MAVPRFIAGDWLEAGATGFGFGTDLFTPRYPMAEIERRALGLIAAYRQARRIAT